MSQTDLGKLQTLAITVTLSPGSIDKLKKIFKTVHYHPDGKVPEKLLGDIEVWFANWAAFPEVVESLDQIPKVRLLQISSAGANAALKNKILQDKRTAKQISVSSGSGIHAYSIPQYIVAQIINLYMSHHIQFDLLRASLDTLTVTEHNGHDSNAKWPSRETLSKAAHPGEKGPFTSLRSRSLYGKTVGFLGYGHIGREAARLLKAFNVEIIAANSSGEKKTDEGYIVPGTGDLEGSLPSKYYSTTDEKSFLDFLSKTDILVASLPSTPATTGLLNSKHLKALPDGAVFVNVGRGDLVSSKDLLAALDAPGGLSAIALDVTDPEPLPDHHPLFTHPHAIVTPHTSGDAEGYFDRATDLLIANIERIRGGGKPMNKIDLEKGY